MYPSEIGNIDASVEIAKILKDLHQNGPKDQHLLERLAYIKKFYPEVFEHYESALMFKLGLFYKTAEPKDVTSLIYNGYKDEIVEKFGKILTPVQASIKGGIENFKFFSFSAPTSAGKSYVFRDLIKEAEKDIVIVVPSRALLTEFIIELREILHSLDDILILPFIDNVNIKRTKKRVFVVTPERGVELFRMNFDIGLFLFDEAQMSDDKNRGIIFDSFVRRASQKYTNAKFVFAHPFVDNPIGQLSRHNIKESFSAKVYNFNTVGKIFIEYKKKDNEFFYFSPYKDKNNHKKNKLICTDVPFEVLKNNGSILIFVSKTSIYEGKFQEDFKRYIDSCGDVVDEEALSIIDQVESHIGAVGYSSNLVRLMKKGVVIHHGSIPLKVRQLIESFTRAGYAKICFATSTLVQGINMPFNLVWVYNLRFNGSEEDRILGLKNLIGRAGRTTNHLNCYDYGYVLVNNLKLFTERINSSSSVISEASRLDKEVTKEPSNIEEEYILSLKNQEIVDEYDLPKSRVERLRTIEVHSSVQYLLENLFVNGNVITGSEYAALGTSKLENIQKAFKNIYKASLMRELTIGEASILSTSIRILLWQIQGRSFREIVSLRYKYVTNDKEKQKLKKAYKNNEISKNDYESKLSKIRTRFSAKAINIPDKKLKNHVSLVYGPASNINYDSVVYDTYDYIDKVISFSLAKTYIAAFDNYHKVTLDIRAKSLSCYFKYGTDDIIEIWLVRYGFSFEEIEWLKDHIDQIDEEEIIFLPSIRKLNEEQMECILRYL